MIGKRLVALAMGLTGCAHVAATPPAPVTPATVVLANRIVLPADDEWQALTVVTRDVDTPDRPIAGALVLVAKAGADFTSPRSKRVETNTNGVQTVNLSESGEFRVSVRRVGYETLQFTVHLRSRCRQTIEIYLGGAVTYLEGPNPSPRTPGRVVLTTCPQSA